MGKIIDSKKLPYCSLHVDGKQLIIKTPNGEDIPRIVSISASQKAPSSYIGICKVELTLWAKIDANNE